MTDWDRIERMTDEDIDFSDNPELTPEMFDKAVVRRGLKPKPEKELLSIQMDSDVVRWFKQQGQEYQSTINTLLRDYMERQSQ